MAARTFIAVSIATASLMWSQAATAQKPKASKRAAARKAPAKKAAAAPVVADAATDKQAQAAAPRLPVAPASAAPAPAGKIDPLEAALAQAMSRAEAPVVATPAPAANAGGLSALRDLSRSAASATLLGNARDKAIPSGEMVEHMKAATLVQTEVSRVITRNLHQLAYCHARLLARGKQADGDASLRFVVEPKGNVSKVEAHASGADAGLLESCVEARVARWRFPMADAPTTVDYPLVFDTAREGDAR